MSQARTGCLFRSVLALVVIGPGQAASSADPGKLCLDAARAAAETTGVPLDVLLALTMVETGRGDGPWPWTVNLGGQGFWLDSPEEAETLVRSALQEGRTNIDLGCFQLNYRWHAAAFPSISVMLEPEANAVYAARYLAEKHEQTGDWAAAAAAYHSATPEHAERYRERFALAWESPFPESVDPDMPANRINRFPLLMAGSLGAPGSLVPQGQTASPLIGAP